MILIGLGIDFGVHYVARYLQLRRDCRTLARRPWSRRRAGVGPGIVTGAVTTAIAFFMAGFTEFTGVAELGMIAGGGILLCCLAAHGRAAGHDPPRPTPTAPRQSRARPAGHPRLAAAAVRPARSCC